MVTFYYCRFIPTKQLMEQIRSTVFYITSLSRGNLSHFAHGTMKKKQRDKFIISTDKIYTCEILNMSNHAKVTGTVRTKQLSTKLQLSNKD